MCTKKWLRSHAFAFSAFFVSFVFVFAEVVCRAPPPAAAAVVEMVAAAAEWEVSQRACTRSSEYGFVVAMRMAIPRVFLISVRGAGHVAVSSSFSLPLAFPLCTSVQVSRSQQATSHARQEPHQTPHPKH